MASLLKLGPATPASEADKSGSAGELIDNRVHRFVSPNELLASIPLPEAAQDETLYLGTPLNAEMTHDTEFSGNLLPRMRPCDCYTDGMRLRHSDMNCSPQGEKRYVR